MLNYSALISGLPGAMNRDYPRTSEEAAQQWANAVRDWMMPVVPVSTTVEAAVATLQAQLLGIFRLQQLPNPPHSSAPQLDAAFQVFGVNVAVGMLPAYTAAPPPSPPGFAQAALRGSYARTRAEGVQRIASMLQQWALTGTAVLVAPPFTPVVWT